jgi:hypothetical protein
MDLKPDIVISHPGFKRAIFNYSRTFLDDTGEHSTRIHLAATDRITIADFYRCA